MGDIVLSLKMSVRLKREKEGMCKGEAWGKHGDILY